MDVPGPGITKITDEKFLGQWIERGFTELLAYLTRYAAFDAWLSAHPDRSLDG